MKKERKLIRAVSIRFSMESYRKIEDAAKADHLAPGVWLRQRIEKSLNGKIQGNNK